MPTRMGGLFTNTHLAKKFATGPIFAHDGGKPPADMGGYRATTKPVQRTRLAALLSPMESVMPWTLLVVAGLFEVAWAVGLKYTDGFSKPMPTVLTVGAMLASIGLLGLAMKHLPVGTAYAVWTGIGTVGTVLLGIVLLGDSASPVRLGCVALIILGIAGLKLTA
jgi:quaternary ammonium compound-resistance protein SugE